MANDTGKRIVTEHLYPPIPLRTMDWCAYFDGEEELGRYGYGRTEAEAMADLLDQLDGADERRSALTAT